MGPRSNILNPCDGYRSRDFKWGCIWTLLVMLGVTGPGKSQSVDPMAQHLATAQDSLRAGNLDTAADEYKAFLAEAVHRAGNARARTGDLTGAAVSLREALEFSGDNVAVRLDYASALFDQGQIKEAGEAVQAAVSTEPGNARAEMLLGQILFEEKEYKAAATHLQKAADLGGFSQAWHPLAIAYLRNQQLDRARGVLAQTITKLGDTPENRVTAATVYYYGDRPEEATAELKKVIAMYPSTRDAHYYLALAYLARNEEAGYAKAIPELRAELALNSDDFRSHYMLGYIAMQQRRFSDAEQELVKARALNPADPGVQLLLGQVYSETNHPSQAEQTLRALISSGSEKAVPDFTQVRAHYVLGRVLREGGHLEEGATEINKAEQLRRQLRGTSTEGSETRLKSMPGISEENGLSADRMLNNPNSAEEAKAGAFIADISPLIGEAYYNLAGISARRKDSVTSAHYLQMAVAWDPSLAKVQH